MSIPIRFTFLTKYRVISALVSCICLQFTIVSASPVKHNTKDDEGEVVISAIPGKKDAIFPANSSISYNVSLDNKYDSKQTGTLSYKIFTLTDKQVGERSVNVSIS